MLDSLLGLHDRSYILPVLLSGSHCIDRDRIHAKSSQLNMATPAVQPSRPQDLELQMSSVSTKPEQSGRDGAESEPDSIFLRVCKNFSTVWSVSPPEAILS